MVWAAGEINLVFYANYGRVVGWDHEWVQDALMVTVVMFHRVVIYTNPDKTKYMVCTPSLYGESGVRRLTNDGQQGKERRLGRGRGRV